MNFPATIAPNAANDTLEDIVELVEIAKQTVPPLWPLESPIAINPLAGFEDLPFGEAVGQASHIFNAPLKGAIRHWRKLAKEGKVDTTVLAQVAIERLGGPDTAFREVTQGIHALDLLSARLLEVKDFGPSQSIRSLGPAEQFVAKWCGAFFDRGLAAHPMPWRAKGLYRAVLALCAHDRQFEALAGGRSQAQAILATMPDDPYAAIRDALFEREGGHPEHLAWLRHMIARLPGWAGHLRWRSERADPEIPQDAPASIADLLALWALMARCGHADIRKTARDHDPRPAIPRHFGLPDRTFEHLGGQQRAMADFILGMSDVDLVLMFMEAAEREYAGKIASSLRKSIRHTATTETQRADAQLVFCIDVRSEPMRRAIEAAGNYKTIGYAGFFGLPIALRSPIDARKRRQLPVLLEPQHEVVHQDETCDPQLVNRVRQGLAIRQVAGTAKQGFASSFTMAEATGPLAGLMLAMRSLAPQLAEKVSAPHPDVLHAALPLCTSRGEDSDLPLHKKLDYALGLFQLTGLQAQHLAPLVLLAGHGATTVNNAFAGALDCGACGGRAGGPNARLLAHILNEDAVRRHLANKGHVIPEDTWFVAAQHDTTTDVVEIFDEHLLPVAHSGPIAALKLDLEKAASANRDQRAARLGRTAADLVSGAYHWGEVRPEWGLAGNAAFLIADRAVSKEVDLEGRAFLHSYDWQQDDDGSALAAIMTAPMIVAQWISCQYLFSTLNNTRYGAGDKSTHNVIGGVGVVQGNGGDLCVGLPYQSLFRDDGTPYHVPQRLLVVVHAPVERVDRIVVETPLLTRLFGNGWLKLVVIDPKDNTADRWLSGETITHFNAAPGGWAPNHYAI
ncbi:UPF0753 protein [Novosphingobium indicum]|uniref:Probable inorganic carbon transporter subunit DabA n=1 Tax=Novosphingobium indicum TaxID=462949 RepID=A0ABQ2JS64_9SPHN|nr:putative inorganic carbon transporter subunit DabA [Novosphingobium indicum]GGN52367.1 UPF0753 protein [Novosphingobium indicum]